MGKARHHYLCTYITHHLHRALKGMGWPVSRVVRMILYLTPWSKLQRLMDVSTSGCVLFAIAVPKKHTKDRDALRAALHAAVDRIIDETEHPTDDPEWTNN